MGSISEYHQSQGGDLTNAEPRKIVVLGVPWQTEDTTLLSHFSEYGTVEEAQIMRERYTGKSRGFGFVTFATTTEAQHATTAEHVIDGRRCEAKFALPEGKVGSARTTRIFVARIPSSVSDIQFRSYFEQFGTVQDAYMPKDPSKQGHRGIGFVTYASPDSVERVMAGTHVLNGNKVAIDRATPKDRTPGASLPGRLSMSQPNLHMLSAAGGIGGGSGSGTGSAHGGGAFPAFMRSGGASGGGLGSGVFPPNNPSSYYYTGEAAAGGGSGGPFSGSGNGGGLGSRHMSHPVLSTSQFGSPPHHHGSSSMNIVGRGGGSGYASSSSGANLQAIAAQAALQQHLSSNSLSSLDGSNLSTSTPHQQQLINLINANVAAAGAVAAAASPPAGLQQRNGSTSHFPPSGPSSTNDLTAILPQQQLDSMQQTHSSPWMHPGAPSGRNLQGGASAGDAAPVATPPSGGPPSARAGPRIFVGKLNRETSDQDVKDYFSRFGYVLDVYLPRDKSNKREHRGFGFVTFETEASIQRVVSHGPHYIRGSVIAIDSAVPRQDEMMVLTIDNPSQQQHVQYHHHQQHQQQPQQYYHPPQHHPIGVGGGFVGQFHSNTAPMPVPGLGSSHGAQSNGGGGSGGGSGNDFPLNSASGSSNLAAETLQAFEGLSLGHGSSAGAAGNGGALSSM
jgi:RNA-binding protein Musashi